ncbi:MAG: thioesterase [Gordonia sp. (in: high G+C Gram-positive bacteria)]|uniref:acyl-[acyl-carrier-protein] thioesterase n=1 Tax=Gordonia sp. (in: high G+C Gram-positive bacteria) TaxID=84139 RepID=UPI0039E585DD
MADDPKQYPPEYVPLEDRKEGARFYENDYRVRTGDIDPEARVRLDGLARYLQDVANDNYDAAGFAETDPFWIVRRTVIDVLSPMVFPANFHAERWCGALSTRWTDMRVTMRSTTETSKFHPDPRPDGHIEAVGFWINVNDQGMPSRISDELMDGLMTMTDEHRLRYKAMNPEKAPSPDEVELPDREHVLRSTDFDPFKHLNNAAYLEAIEDELVDHPDLVASPHRMVIEYLRPITPGTQIMLRRRRVDDCLFVWMLIPGGDGEQVVAATVTVRTIP